MQETLFFDASPVDLFLDPARRTLVHGARLPHGSWVVLAKVQIRLVGDWTDTLLRAQKQQLYEWKSSAEFQISLGGISDTATHGLSFSYYTDLDAPAPPEPGTSAEAAVSLELWGESTADHDSISLYGSSSGGSAQVFNVRIIAIQTANISAFPRDALEGDAVGVLVH